MAVTRRWERRSHNHGNFGNANQRTDNAARSSPTTETNPPMFRATPTEDGIV
jgi:hypothetical protein